MIWCLYAQEHLFPLAIPFGPIFIFEIFGLLIILSLLTAKGKKGTYCIKLDMVFTSKSSGDIFVVTTLLPTCKSMSKPQRCQRYKWKDSFVLPTETAVYLRVSSEGVHFHLLYVKLAILVANEGGLSKASGVFITVWKVNVGAR